MVLEMGLNLLLGLQLRVSQPCAAAAKGANAILGCIKERQRMASQEQLWAQITPGLPVQIEPPPWKDAEELGMGQSRATAKTWPPLTSRRGTSQQSSQP